MIMDPHHLWQALAGGDTAARDRLVEEHLGLVYHALRQLEGAIPQDTDFEEYVSAGTMGLLSAIDHFDAARGHAFSTFAVPRIRGAILDELRRRGSVSRSARRKARDLTRAREELARELGRSPTDRELAERLEIDVETLWRWETDSVAGMTVPLDAASAGHDGDSPTLHELFALTEPTIEDELTHEQEVALVREALKQLTEQERTVIALYYYEELKLHEIAKVLGLTESRISQVRTKALGKLRAAVAPVS
jgi:RNA polymerase sigma factor for flagellar operon FliA